MAVINKLLWVSRPASCCGFLAMEIGELFGFLVVEIDELCANRWPGFLIGGVGF